jgi:hypothetical protein
VGNETFLKVVKLQVKERVRNSSGADPIALRKKPIHGSRGSITG